MEGSRIGNEGDSRWVGTKVKLIEFLKKGHVEERKKQIRMDSVGSLRPVHPGNPALVKMRSRALEINTSQSRGTLVSTKGNISEIHRRRIPAIGDTNWPREEFAIGGNERVE